MKKTPDQLTKQFIRSRKDFDISRIEVINGVYTLVYLFDQWHTETRKYC